jgi:hypothetical protein
MKLGFMINRIHGQSSIEHFNSFMGLFNLHTSVTQKVTTINVIYGIIRYGLYRENKGNYKDNDSGIGWYFSWFGSLLFNKGKNFYTRKLVQKWNPILSGDNLLGSFFKGPNLEKN